MRKVIYLLATISLVGCTRVEPQYSVIKVKHIRTRVGKFEYSGHTYISFTTGSGSTRALGVVHDLIASVESVKINTNVLHK